MSCKLLPIGLLWCWGQAPPLQFGKPLKCILKMLKKRADGIEIRKPSALLHSLAKEASHQSDMMSRPE